MLHRAGKNNYHTFNLPGEIKAGSEYWLNIYLGVKEDMLWAKKVMLLPWISWLFLVMHRMHVIDLNNMKNVTLTEEVMA